MLIYQNAHQSAQLLQVWYRNMLHGLTRLTKIWGKLMRICIFLVMSYESHQCNLLIIFGHDWQIPYNILSVTLLSVKCFKT